MRKGFSIGWGIPIGTHVPVKEGLVIFRGTPRGGQSFLGLFTGRQALEKRCAYGGSIKSISVERDSFGERQPLQSRCIAPTAAR